MFRLELITMLATAAPAVKVASEFVPITETPVVKSERNEEQVEDGQSSDGTLSTRPILLNSVCSTKREPAHPL